MLTTHASLRVDFNELNPEILGCVWEFFLGEGALWGGRGRERNRRETVSFIWELFYKGEEKRENEVDKQLYPLL